MTAYGGYGFQYGAAGTIFTKSESQGNGDLEIDNNNNLGSVTTLPDGNYVFDSITVKNKAKMALSSNSVITADNLTAENGTFIYYNTGTLDVTHVFPQGEVYIDQALTTNDITVPSGAVFYINASLTTPSITIGGTVYLNVPLTVPSLSVLDGGVLSHSSLDPDFDLTVTNDLAIDLGGRINVTGMGYPSSTGPGAGIYNYYCPSGAGYGGAGGNSRSVAGGAAYGSITEPNDLGSGGGNNHYFVGGSGGGLIKVECLGTLTVNGNILSEGNNGGTWNNYYSSGGSGGSIYINAGTLAGSGIISANGGNGAGNNYTGGGGGGRIAIYYTENNYTGDITAYGGYGFQYGEDGTIYLSDLSPKVGENILTPANNQFFVEENSQGTYSVQLENQDIIPHTADIAILNSYPNVVVTLGQENITLLSGESATIPIIVDASSALPGTYDIQIEISGDDGSITYSNIDGLLPKSLTFDEGHQE
jgi:hypothetical protein